MRYAMVRRRPRSCGLDVVVRRQEEGKERRDGQPSEPARKSARGQAAAAKAWAMEAGVGDGRQVKRRERLEVMGKIGSVPLVCERTNPASPISQAWNHPRWALPRPPQPNPIASWTLRMKEECHDLPSSLQNVRVTPERRPNIRCSYEHLSKPHTPTMERDQVVKDF